LNCSFAKTSHRQGLPRRTPWDEQPIQVPGGTVVSREHEVRLPDRFWRHCTKISTGAKALYSILLTFIDYNTAKTQVGNVRLERESGYGRDKVKSLLAELERNKFIERKRLYAGNLKSKRILSCLRFLSIDGFSVNRSMDVLSVAPKISPISLPSQSHPSPIPKQEGLSEPFPSDAEKPQRVM
jgi:hypothetical protein